MQNVPPTGHPPRLLPEIPFPPYSYVPGKFPHPTRATDGHGAIDVAPLPDKVIPDRWRDYPHYLWGLDLLNHGYYWEAHESWEALWHVAGRHGPVADFFKALIKLAAAGFKAREGRVNGIRRHARRAERLFAKIAASGDEPTDDFMGFSLQSLGAFAADIAQRSDAIIDTTDHPVVRVLPDVLCPERI